jgi:hypothetical protein
MNNAVATEITHRIRAEFIEMPGLCLSPEQVQRLCGVDGAICRSVLETLVESGFLSQRLDGSYGRDRSPDFRARQAKATLIPGEPAAAARNESRAS